MLKKYKNSYGREEILFEIPYITEPYENFTNLDVYNGVEIYLENKNIDYYGWYCFDVKNRNETKRTIEVVLKKRGI